MRRETLYNDPDSRQAVITINCPGDYTYDNKDVPCTFSIQFMIRDSRLHMIVNMRSNDIILGFCNDIFQFSMIYELLYAKLRMSHPEKFKDLQRGLYYHNAASMHIYERHYDMARDIIEDWYQCEETYMPVPYSHVDAKDMDILNTLLCDLVAIMDTVGQTKSKKLSLDEMKQHPSFAKLDPYWKKWVLFCWVDGGDSNES